MVAFRSQENFDQITKILRHLELKHLGTAAWDDSPFKWVLALPSATKGALGRSLVREWGQSLDIRMDQVSHDSQIYLDLNGFLIQIKFSTLWDAGYYRFQQIRDRDYDYCLCLGLAPFDMNAWLIPKDVLDTYVIGLKGQHTGASSGETWWLEVSPVSQEPWLEDCGGQLADVGQALRQMANLI